MQAAANALCTLVMVPLYPPNISPDQAAQLSRGSTRSNLKLTVEYLYGGNTQGTPLLDTGDTAEIRVGELTSPTLVIKTIAREDATHTDARKLSIHM